MSMDRSTWLAPELEDRADSFLADAALSVDDMVDHTRDFDALVDKRAMWFGALAADVAAIPPDEDKITTSWTEVATVQTDVSLTSEKLEIDRDKISDLRQPVVDFRNGASDEREQTGRERHIADIMDNLAVDTYNSAAIIVGQLSSIVAAEAMENLETAYDTWQESGDAIHFDELKHAVLALYRLIIKGAPGASDAMVSSGEYMHRHSHEIISQIRALVETSSKTPVKDTAKD